MVGWISGWVGGTGGRGPARGPMIKHHSQNAGKHYRDGKSGQPKIRNQRSMEERGTAGLGGSVRRSWGALLVRACRCVQHRLEELGPLSPNSAPSITDSRAGLGVVEWGYADPTGCQQTTGKWMPEKAITMINLVQRFSD